MPSPRQGIKVAVQGVATFKIGADDESIRNAAERFLEAQESEVDSIVKNVLEGSLRSIVGTLTVEELNLDRQKFQQAVQDAAKGDLATSGPADRLRSRSRRSATSRLHGPHRPAGDGPPRAGRPDGQGDGRPGGRGPRGRGRAGQAQRRSATSRSAGGDRDADRRGRGEARRRPGRWPRPRRPAGGHAQADRAGPARGRPHPEGAHRRAPSGRPRPRRRRRSGAPRATRAPGSPRPRPMPSGSSWPARPRRRSRSPRARRRPASSRSTPRPTAKQTTLEGNAEAGIVFTKGEAEAKALALRAEAYRQFNEAAIIQTVLSMLPEIVRAAAEPMAKIDNLTVLSTDGASDVVKNVTRTVTEARATVKGLTGIDIPDLLNQAMGGTAAGEDRRPAGRSAVDRRAVARVVAACGRSAAGSGGGGTAGAASRRLARVGATTASVRDGPPADATEDVRRRAERRGLGPGRCRSRAASRHRDPRRPRPSTPRWQPTTGRAVRRGRPRPRAAAPTPRRGPTGPASASIDRETTVEEAARRLATDLRAVPGHRALRDGPPGRARARSGPRPLRTMWRIAREQLDRALRPADHRRGHRSLRRRPRRST